MRFGIRIPFQGEPTAGDVRQVALAADEAGLDSGWVGDHVGFPASETTSRYPGSSSGGYGKSTHVMHLDPWCTLAYAGAITSRLRLGTSLTILPYRHPLLVAKAVATVDHLTGGRAVLGVGLGWVEEEYAALGIPFGTRASRFEEGIDALRALLGSSTPEFHGSFFDFGPIDFDPQPIQDDIPIIIGGNSAAARRRAGAKGDGFAATRQSPDEAVQVVKEVRAAHADSPRHAMPFTVLNGIAIACEGDPEQPASFAIKDLPDAVRRYEDAGVDLLILDTYNQRAAELLPIIEAVEGMDN
jgi:probable F420-dependent oxidoreductase